MNRQAFYLALSTLSLSLSLATARSTAQTLPLEANLIEFDSPRGEQFLLESQAKRDYIPLSIQFTTQDNRAYCGVASMVIALNALKIEAPFAPQFGRNYFTQDNVLNEKTDEVIPATLVARQGMTLQQLGGLLKTYPVQVSVHHASDLSLDQFRDLAIQNLQQPNNFVLVNYLRRTIGQEAGGHISPLAAYHEESDRFLILDVSRYKYPPVWVKAEELWQAMMTIDSVVDQTRGVVFIQSQP